MSWANPKQKLHETPFWKPERTVVSFHWFSILPVRRYTGYGYVDSVWFSPSLVFFSFVDNVMAKQNCGEEKRVTKPMQNDKNTLITLKWASI